MREKKIKVLIAKLGLDGQPDKEIPKLKELVMVRQPGVISARVYLSKLVEPRACRERPK